MILIITHKEDFTVDFVIDKLNEKNINYYRLNCEDIEAKGYTIEFGKSTQWEINKKKSFTSVWFRRTKLPSLNTLSKDKQLYLLADYDTLLSNLFHLIDAKKWMSHPKYVYEAENKLLQLKLATNLGFQIPDTLVTSNKSNLKDFAKKYLNDIIIKPINNGRILDSESFKNIFTNKLKKEHLENLNDFDLTPTIFQERIEKEYELRVTVVGTYVFSAKVNSQSNEETKIDWRKEKLKFTKYNLPSEVEKKCINLLSHLNLSFGAIDLIKSKNGEYIFLEINPNGQWAWIEFDTGLPISNAIINYLL